MKLTARSAAVLLLLAVVHLSLAAVIITPMDCMIKDHVHKGHTLPVDFYIVGAVLVGVAISAASLAARPNRYIETIGRALHRSGILPELLIVSAILITAALLLVGSSLSPLMERVLFASGIRILPVAICLVPPALMDRRRFRRLLGNVGVSLFGLLLATMVLEVFLRLFVKDSLYSPYLDLRPNIRVESRIEIPGIAPVCILTTNSLGLRGDEPPEDWDGFFTILTVGGSTTHCSYLNDDRTWPGLLQFRLRRENAGVWVGNGGLDGHSTRGHVIFMREVVPQLNPDMVIVLCGINDLALSLRRDRLEVDLPVDMRGIGGYLYRSSRLIRFLTLWKRVLFDDARVRSMDFFLDPVPLDLPEDSLPHDIEMLLSTLPEYRANIRTIIDLGREQGVTVVFLTQPTLLEDNDYWRGLAPPYENVTGLYSYATKSLLLDTFNRELIRVCEEENVPYFDLAEAVGHDPVLFTDDVHFTEAGTALIARLVADYLLAEGLIKEL